MTRDINLCHTASQSHLQQLENRLSSLEDKSSHTHITPLADASDIVQVNHIVSHTNDYYHDHPQQRECKSLHEEMLDVGEAQTSLPSIPVADSLVCPLLAALPHTTDPASCSSPNSATVTYVHPNVTVRKVSKYKKPLMAFKSLFVSRLNLLTTSTDVLSRIKSHLSSIGIDSNHELIRCKKITRSGSRVASFKIILPDEFFVLLISPSPWPSDTFLQEFIFKRKPSYRSQVVSYQKNLNACPFTTRM